MKRLLLLLAFPLLIASCSKDDGGDNPPPGPPPAPEYKLLKEVNTQEGNFKIEIYGLTDFIDGYNTLRYVIKNKSGDVVKNAEVVEELKSGDNFFPVRPVTMSSDDYYVAGVVFFNADNPSRDYTLTIKVSIGEIFETAIANINAANIDDVRLTKINSSIDERDVIVALIRPLYGIKAGTQDYLALFIAKQEESGEWKIFENLGANIDITSQSPNPSFSLPYAENGIYLTPNQLTFEAAGVITIDVSATDGELIVFEKVPLEFTVN